MATLRFVVISRSPSLDTERHADAAKAFNFGFKMITWAYANHWPQGASEDDVACSERLTKLSHCAGEPNGRIQRVAQALSTTSGTHDLTMFGKAHRCTAQVQAIDALRRATEHKAPA
ncbi:hypothetical protein D9M73_213990 [compost metagenome]